MATVEKVLIYHVFLVLLSGTRTLTGIRLEQSALEFLSEQCSKDCTKGENLTCKIQLQGNCEYDPTGVNVPNKPNVTDSLIYQYQTSSKVCDGHLSLSWTPPVDETATRLKGFKIKIKCESGDCVNMDECAIFSMPHTAWTKDDILKKYVYTFDCFKPLWGKYFVQVCSLPLSSNGSNCWEKSFKIMTQMYGYDGTCKQYTARTTPSISNHSSPFPHIVPKQPNHSSLNTKIIYYVSGAFVIALVVMAVFVAMIVFRNKKNNPGLLPPFHSDIDPRDQSIQEGNNEDMEPNNCTFTNYDMYSSRNVDYDTIHDYDIKTYTTQYDESGYETRSNNLTVRTVGDGDV